MTNNAPTPGALAAWMNHQLLPEDHKSRRKSAYLCKMETMKIPHRHQEVTFQIAKLKIKH